MLAPSWKNARAADKRQWRTYARAGLAELKAMAEGELAAKQSSPEAAPSADLPVCTPLPDPGEDRSGVIPTDLDAYNRLLAELEGGVDDPR